MLSYSHVRLIDGDSFRCEASITLREGAVDSVRYRGTRSICASLLKGCKPG